MTVEAKNCWKKFGREWIFKNFTWHFEKGTSYALTGNNGSGKTTLLKALAGVMPLNRGSVEYFQNGKKIDAGEIYRYLVYTGPYTELVEEFTLLELVNFYQVFKPLSLSPAALLAELQLEKVHNRPVKFFSSGMKQKVKLGLAFFSQADLVLLDEPTSNFDETNTAWYLETARAVRKQKLLIICSNQPVEYDFCEEVINLSALK